MGTKLLQKFSGVAGHRFAEWRSQTRSRNELMDLDDHVLQDIGVARRSVSFEAAKPFWMA